MIFLKILPGILKELTRHVPTVFFQVVEWSEIASEVPKLTKKILQKEGFQDFFEKQKSYLSPLPVKMEAKAPLDTDQNFSAKSGEELLQIYFAQLYSPLGMFVDLRPQNFSADKDQMTWYPTGAWTKLSENFRQGILKVYEGFYLEKEDLYYSGLVDIGLMNPAWSDTEKKKLADLFKDQFGDANTESVEFNLVHFNASMSKMFNFILQKKHKITKDFLYLGIYLVTLYSALEKVGKPLPVKKIYLKIREEFGS